ncbi:MAG: serine/threonine protein kinase, partial [Deltaproteobacteria bacterium]
MTKPKATDESAPRASPPGRDPPERIAGRYRVTSMLGRGGFGQVYAAVDELTDREVALKLIRHRDLTARGGDTTSASEDASRASMGPFGRAATRRTVTRTFGSTPESASSEAVSQFREEFRILTQLHHPNLASVFDFGRCKELDAEYFTQELVRGPVLSDFLKGASRETIAAIFVQLAQALDYIHTLGLIHDDIKPSNVLVDTDDEERGPQAKLIDFGLVQVVRGRAPHASADDDSIVVLGTPGFAAPEKVRGEPADVRSDIYSLGATMYAAIRGQRPFAGKTFKEVLRAQKDWRPELAGALVPSAGPVVAELIGRMLDPDPAKRPPSARTIVLELLRREAPHLRDHGPTKVDRREFARLLVEHLPFVDRDKILEGLLRRASEILLGNADAGASRSGARPRLIRTVIVEAPEGMGKQRLMAELRREIQIGDGLFIEANCWSSESGVLGPFG